jgi:hypothetical protein
MKGAVLSPMLFNIYLEHAVKTQPALRQAIDRGSLKAFADDMLVQTNEIEFMEGMITGFKNLDAEFSLQLNASKYYILTKK